METAHIITFNLALLAAILSPGPAFLYSVQTSLQSGRKAGVAAGVGLAVMAATWTLLAKHGVRSFNATYAALKDLTLKFFFG